LLYLYFGIFLKKAFLEWHEAQSLRKEIIGLTKIFFFQIANNTFDNNQLASEKLLEIQRRIIYRHLAFLISMKEFAIQNTSKDFEGYLDKKEFNVVKRASNVPFQILKLQSEELKNLNKKAYVPEQAYVNLQNLGMKFIHCIGDCEFMVNKGFRNTNYKMATIGICFFIVIITLSTAPYLGFWSIIFSAFWGYGLFLLQNLQQYYLTPFNNSTSKIEINKTINEIEYDSLTLIVGEEVNNLLGKI
jgi:putative membrane protein